MVLGVQNSVAGGRHVALGNIGRHAEEHRKLFDLKEYMCYKFDVYVKSMYIATLLLRSHICINRLSKFTVYKYEQIVNNMYIGNITNQVMYRY